ncbi:TetR/AcrR family transcriptional regulator C-terminal domain-containing protein [Streptomyces sp. SID3343]|uniref:TetR/AcrR family transcriptional regulator C-terminal domain-containing protein n=1 Tax=Streptomyces sp. SID3343 TaxID=2690260 RepID=UPI00136855E3|nr:TetR/AcrR family transcriptional regulator C-terminal domain-containing protein [Streptomyces sp. SID3343]MYV97124.1 GntR family transcriptional regulator [Streptomyces sp. SID3343]
MTRSPTPSALIAAELRRRIEAGELRPGDRVPSTRAITAEWGVAMATATRALTVLREAGLVTPRRGVGTVVADRAKTAARIPVVAVPMVHKSPRTDAELTRQRIVEAAIAIADADGLGAVSMRRIAAELGVAAMTLYRHIPGKDDLVAAMADTVFGERPLPTAGPIGWRARLETSCRLQWEMYRRHPWLAHTMSMTRPLPTVRGMMHVEWSMAEFEDLTPDVMIHIAVTMLNYVRGTAINLALEDEAERATGVSSEEWLQAQDATMELILRTNDFPMYAAALTSPDLLLDLDSLFTFGLDRILDGIGTLVANQR